MRVFATVGTTQFDGLIECLCTEVVIEKLKRVFGLDELVLQIGRGSFLPPGVPESLERDVEYGTEMFGVKVRVFRFRDTLADLYEAADVVISHAGAGSIFEALRAEKVLIVVTNDELMSKHQNELAIALQERNHLFAANLETILDVLDSVQTKKHSLKPLKSPDFRLFQAIIDSEFIG